MQTNKKTDNEIQKCVLDELKWDGHVKAANIGVVVESGVVTLQGTVDSWAGKMAAQDAAHRVSGVLDVANEIRVERPGTHIRSDADIARATRTALEWDVMIFDQQIKTSVSNGVVTLEGKVETWTQHDDVSRCIRNLSGVVEVRNLISVEPSTPKVGAATLRSVIAQALERHAEHAAKHINLEVTDGQVRLSGDVPTWAERDLIEGAVRGTRGVQKVSNELRVRS